MACAKSALAMAGGRTSKETVSETESSNPGTGCRSVSATLTSLTMTVSVTSSSISKLTSPALSKSTVDDAPAARTAFPVSDTSACAGWPGVGCCGAGTELPN